jgi:pyrimidine operon attenuation protein/uracil phosphoribosyltransferase
MAHELAEKVAEKPILLLGLNERGLALATALHDSLERFGLGNSTVLPVNMAGKNSSSVSSVATNSETLNQVQSHQGVLVLCDDVIFSGKTLFELLKELPQNQNDDIEAILISTLIDRGHRVYPITPTVCGLFLPTKEGEHITVKLSEEVKMDGKSFKRLESVELELSK